MNLLFDAWEFLKGRTQSDLDILQGFFRFKSQNYKTP